LGNSYAPGNGFDSSTRCAGSPSVLQSR
jgi:hypothetical protein